MLRISLNSAINGLKQASVFQPQNVQPATIGNVVLKLIASRSLSQSAAIQFNASPFILAKTKSPQQVKQDELKALLKKEKKVYLKLKSNYSKEVAKQKAKAQKLKQKEADAKAKMKNKKLLQKALKEPRKLSAFNAYVKEFSGKKLTEASAEWKQLSESEKDSYTEKAKQLNVQRAELFPPKPKSPIFGFAAYLKMNHPNDGSDATDVVKALASEWKSLPSNEKAKYDKDPQEWESYKNKLNLWKQKRISSYNETNGTNITI